MTPPAIAACRSVRVWNMETTIGDLRVNPSDKCDSGVNSSDKCENAEQGMYLA